MELPARLSRVQARINAAALACGRNPQALTLIAVSKTQPASAVEQAAGLGLRHFGENYLQEALAKRASVAAAGLTWHFIGPVQSNKTRDLAAGFDWVHGVDRLKIAQRLSDQRPAGLPPLQLCVQVNISGEASKSGVPVDEAADLCRQVAALPRLQLRGLMAIPATDDTPAFARMQALYQRLQAQGLALDTLSMGMSEDLEAAIAHGATHLRIGSAIFGARG